MTFVETVDLLVWIVVLGLAMATAGGVGGTIASTRGDSRHAWDALGVLGMFVCSTFGATLIVVVLGLARP